MEHLKILNFLNEATLDLCQENGKLSMINQTQIKGNEITYNTEILKCNIFDYTDSYILVSKKIVLVGDSGNQVAIKTCAPFTKCITKIDGTTIDDAKDLDLVMLMYNLIKCSSNFSDTTSSLWFYSKDGESIFN